MEVFQYIKKIYQGEGAFYKHLSLFSIIGVMTLLLNNYVASIIGSMYNGFLGYAPFNNNEISFDLFFGLMIIIFLFGYSFKFINALFNQKVGIPEFSLSSYSIFVKVLPLVLAWGIYIFILLFAGISLLPSYLFFIFAGGMFFLLPFISLICVYFAKDFYSDKKLYNPLFLLKVIKCSIIDMIILTIKTILVAIIPVVILYVFFRYSYLIKSSALQLGIRLFGLCSGMYFILIIKYIYLSGLVEISNEKLKNI